MSANSSSHTWLRLMLTAGVGNDTARKLLNAFGLPEHIFQASFSSLKNYVSAKVAENILSKVDESIQNQIDLTLAWCLQDGNHVITLADADYPQALLHIPDPPILLYVKGRLELLNSTTIAVVGSRNATAQGVLNAERFSTNLSQAGVSISSGLALGIDAAAHEGGLLGKGSTIAVIGTGADIVYPARHRNLAHVIAEKGCIVSEYPLGTPALAGNFPRRNRIISGLSSGVLIVEAAAQSGSLITARMAVEQGREVFAIPGSIHSPMSKGCHQLIKQGAKLVETAQDILDELPVMQHSLMSETPQLELTKQETNHCVLKEIGYDPVHFEVLAERTALKAADLGAHLLELELLGEITAIPGGFFQRIA